MAMREQKSHHELADPLLPWFVNGTLDRDEHKMVERHVAGCDECRGNIALLARVRNVIGAAKPTPMVPQPRPDALADAIDARQAQHGPRRAGWVAAASIAALILMSAIFMLGRDRAPEWPLHFETATSNKDPLPMNYVLSVRFDDGATSLDHEQVLKSIGARHISATDDPSVYRVVVALPATSLEDLERYTERIESLPAVRAVKAVALQIPVSRPQ
jgi:hypothetical protein